MAYNRVSKEKRALILAALAEGTPINAAARMFKTGKHAVLRVIEETAAACVDWHNRHFRNLEIERLEMDEQWAYVHTQRADDARGKATASRPWRLLVVGWN